MENDIAKLMTQIEDMRERAATSRRLADGLSRREIAADHLRVYAGELDAKCEELEARAAILKQALSENQVERPIAALKPNPDPEPEG